MIVNSMEVSPRVKETTTIESSMKSSSTISTSISTETSILVLSMMPINQ